MSTMNLSKRDKALKASGFGPSWYWKQDAKHRKALGHENPSVRQARQIKQIKEYYDTNNIIPSKPVWSGEISNGPMNDLIRPLSRAMYKITEHEGEFEVSTDEGVFLAIFKQQEHAELFIGALSP